MRALNLVLPLLVAAMSVLAVLADAATLKTLHDFCPAANCPDGRYPRSMIMDSAGRLYGVTSRGANADTSGTVFMLEPQGNSWKFSVLYSFCQLANCADGTGPQGRLVLDADGALYGTTTAGGASSHREGTVFRLSPNATRTKWKLKVLHSFCDRPCHEGGLPQAGLSYRGQRDGQLYDGVSPLYGVALGGQLVQGCGGSCGLAFRVYPQTKRKWGFQVIYNFCSQAQCKDGWEPYAELVVQNPSTVVGTSSKGGEWGSGLLFKLTKAAGVQIWNQTTLISFCAMQCEDGSFPYAPPAQNGDGFTYGTTGVGRSPFSGSLWKVAPNLQESVLYRFCQEVDCEDGTLPLDTMVTSTGDIYGVTEQGGGHFIDRQGLGGGTVYKHSGTTHTTLWRFCSLLSCADGEYPTSSLAIAPDGKVYGTTSEGGAHDGGTVFELTP